MVVRMRHTKSQRNNRRSHMKAQNPAVVMDKESNSPQMRHRVNPSTGKYRGRQVLDLNKKVAKKLIQKKVVNNLFAIFF